jgi:hypothetical protein
MSEIEMVEVEEVVSMNNLQIYQQDKAVIDMQITTAKKYPRNLKQCINNAITIATLDVETAKSCIYSLKKGGKVITGPSVYLAKIVAQQFGNIRVENRVVGYDATHVTCEGVCFDLENNYAVRTQIRKPIVGNSGRFSEDMCSIIGNAGNSIVFRNAVFAVIPANVVKKIYDAATRAITGDISDSDKLVKRRTLMFKGFKDTYPDFKLTDLEICMSVGKTSIEHITAEDIVALVGFEKSIASGEQTVEAIFKNQQTNIKPKETPPDKGDERCKLLIEEAKTLKDLDNCKAGTKTQELKTLWENKYKLIKSQNNGTK